jgi:DNA-binding NtrC family response regulator
MLVIKGYEVIAFPDASMFSGMDQHLPVSFPQPDFVISDIEMPGINGIEVVKRLITGGFNKNNIAIMSGYWSENEIPEEIRNSIKFFQKPFPFCQLLGWLEEQRILFSAGTGVVYSRDHI